MFLLSSIKFSNLWLRDCATSPSSVKTIFEQVLISSCFANPHKLVVYISVFLMVSVASRMKIC